jgi:hypothetical protein
MEYTIINQIIVAAGNCESTLPPVNTTTIPLPSLPSPLSPLPSPLLYLHLHAFLSLSLGVLGKMQAKGRRRRRRGNDEEELPSRQRKVCFLIFFPAGTPLPPGVGGVMKPSFPGSARNIFILYILHHIDMI